MAEGPAEGEWEEDAGLGAAAAERRREKALEREKAKEKEEKATQQKVRNHSSDQYILRTKYKVCSISNDSDWAKGKKGHTL